MSNAREIRGKIKSVKNTRKVTKALEMVSASKIRKAEEQMARTRPYNRMMRQVAGHIALANPEYVHPFMEVREEVKRVGFILISTDRGLCGGLNTNLFKKALGAIREWDEDKGAEVEMVTIGRKGRAFFRRLGIEMSGHIEHLGEEPQLNDLIGVVKVMMDKYREGALDRVYLMYNDFVNTMTQRPMVDQLLPLPPAEDEAEMRKNWDYIYEPSAEAVLDDILVRYIEVLVYQGVVENLASEHAARMVAMKAASDNANDLIDDLTLVYNKARQAAITQELSEIVGGAAAIGA
ncbi:MAG: F0F1 ATP synthase subunit gamma [Xanthomonadales bacterium]|nr:F0F1 ATP synthase subunit gamma [Xanthomonadales bacterium]